jgi:hypothetical protein
VRERFSERTLILALAAAVAAAGYAAGALAAPSGDEAARVERAARAQAAVAGFASAVDAARRQAERSGYTSGAVKGRIAGDLRGRVAGRDALRRARARARRLSREREAVAAPAPRPLTGSVLVIGDSLEVLTSPHLQRYLPGVKLTINAEGGYSSPALFELFQESYDPAHDVIVFDAGTNDNPAYPQILQEQLAKVGAIVGDRCLVVPTIKGLRVDGIGWAAKNRVIRSFAAARPGTQVPDWEGAALSHPELMQPDNLHPNVEGADHRARLIAEAVMTCLYYSADRELR